MRVLRVLSVAFLTAIVGGVLGIVIGDYVTQLLHVSNMEGGRGMMVMFICAPLGMIAGFLIGLIVGIWSKRPGFVGFLVAEGWSLLILGVIAGIFTGVFYLGSDKPPKVGGKKLALDFELRIPASAKIPEQPDGYAVRVSLYENDRNNRYAFIDWQSIVRGPEQITIPGNVDLMTHSATRSLLASVGDQSVPTLFEVKLAPVPQPQDENWTDWMTAAQRADLKALPEAERYSIRYRVRELP
jgi:MFS family permease